MNVALTWMHRAMILVLFCILSVSVSRTGHTTNDDATLSVSSANYGVWQSTLESAKSQGRIQFFWGYPTLRVPYLIGTHSWYVFSKIFGIFLAIVALFFAVKSVSESEWLGSLSAAIFLLLLQNGWDHNAITSYPFAFNAYLAAFLFSIAAHTYWIKTKRWMWAAASCMLFFYSLAIELFLLYLPVFVLVGYIRSSPPRKNTTSIFLLRIKESINHSLPVTLSAIFYIGIYITWRTMFPSGYDGNQIGELNVLSSLKVVFHYSINALPIYSVLFPFQEGTIASLTGFTSIFGLLLEHPYPIVLKVIVGTLLLTSLFFGRRTPDITQTAMLTFTLILGVCIFLPNALLSLTERHRFWVSRGTHSYLYTYYSFSFFSAFLAFLLSSILTRFNNKFFSISFKILIILLLASLSLLVEIRNTAFFKNQHLSLKKQLIFDDAVLGGFFADIPEGVEVFSQSLPKNHRGIAVLDTNYWTARVKQLTGKSNPLSLGTCGSTFPCHSVEFHQSTWADVQYIYRISRSSPSEPARVRLWISPAFSHPFALSGKFLKSDDMSASISIGKNSISFHKDVSDFILNNIKVSAINNRQYFEFSSSQPIEPDSIKIAF